MNKTININLGGVFFHIDEDAYKTLKNYLDAIRRSLSDDAQGKNEIINDIEYRIGEILVEKIKDVRQVVNQQDIESIIVIMGKPEEYSGDEDFFEDESHTGRPQRKKRKLYRNSNDKFLGGVSSGLGHYFGVDTIWIRLGWLLLLISGVSVILYPILWILLPEATTTSEKLEMEGEPVNISNIERKIREELTDAANRVKEEFDDVSETFKNGNYQTKVKSGIQDIIDLFVKVFSAILQVTGKFIGILLIVLSIFVLISMFIGGFSLASVEFLGLSDEFTNYPKFFYTSRIPIWTLTTLVFIIIAIPFILLFKLGLKIVSSTVSSFSRTTNLSLLGIWLLAIMGLGFAGFEHSVQSSNKYTASKEYIITKPIAETLNIKMLAKDDFGVSNFSDGKSIFVNGVETSYRTNIDLDIRESNTGEMYLKIIKKADAVSVEEAKLYTEEMEYNFEVTNQNLLLDAYFLSDMDHQYSSQYIKLILYIPEGKTIYLDKSTKYFLNDVDNIQDIYDRRMIRHHYKMTKNGLDCLDCDEKNKKESKKTTISVETNITKEKDTNNYSNKDAAEVHEKIKKELNSKGVEI